MNKENDTLIILSPGFPQNEADTTCLPMQQSLILALKNNFPRLTIIILSFQYPYVEKKYQWHGTTVFSFNGKNKGGIKRLLLRKKINTTLKELLNTNKIIGLLSFWCGECALVGKRFADKNNLKHFCWLLGQDAKKENKYPKRTALKGNELIALSDFLQDEYEKNHKERPKYVVPAGIDTKQFDNSIKEKNVDIIAAGSLIPIKQYDIFIKAVAEIKKQIPDVKAVLIGDGPQKKMLQLLIEEYDLQSNIFLTGELPHPEVLQWMQWSKVFLHPSSYEGFGVVMVEALYAGCRVISFCKPMQQVIEQWEVVQSKKEMEEKAIHILKDTNATYKSITFFTIDTIAKKMMQIFGDQ